MNSPERNGTFEKSKPIDVLSRALSAVTGEEIVPDLYDGTYEIDTDSLYLTFTMDDESFEIRSIESKRPGIGGAVVDAIHAFCDRRGLSVYASNVKDTATGFWERKGYQDAGGGEYFRTA